MNKFFAVSSQEVKKWVLKEAMFPSPIAVFIHPKND